MFSTSLAAAASSFFEIARLVTARVPGRCTLPRDDTVSRKASAHRASEMVSNDNKYSNDDTFSNDDKLSTDNKFYDEHSNGSQDTLDTDSQETPLLRPESLISFLNNLIDEFYWADPTECIEDAEYRFDLGLNSPSPLPPIPTSPSEVFEDLLDVGREKRIQYRKRATPPTLSSLIPADVAEVDSNIPDIARLQEELVLYGYLDFLHEFSQAPPSTPPRLNRLQNKIPFMRPAPSRLDKSTSRHHDISYLLPSINIVRYHTSLSVRELRLKIAAKGDKFDEQLLRDAKAKGWARARALVPRFLILRTTSDWTQL